jgi:two-component system, LytTR family, response regulator
MAKIRCLVLDDEPLAIDILVNYISKMPELELAAACTDPMEALSLIHQNKVDLLFLDIQMPTLTGIQFLRVMNGKCKTILTTAYSEFALEGYEYDVADYLLKPISFERFVKATHKAIAQLAPISIESDVTLIHQEDKISKSVAANEIDFIFVKTEYKIQKIMLSDILYIEGLKDYVSIYTTTDRILTLQTMKKMEELLPPNRFARIHKSYIVSMIKIDTIERQRIFIGKHVLPIGDSYVKDFMKNL